MIYNGKLIKNSEGISPQSTIMFCFPYAGGGAAFYAKWIQYFDKKLSVCPIQLPGREERIGEKPYLNMQSLVKDVVDAIMRFDNDFILFGHSMGGKIAFEVEKMLENNKRVAKLAIFSGSRVPHIPEPQPISHLTEQEFLIGLERYDGIPEEIKMDKRLLNFYMPIIRSDFILDESYYPDAPSKLICPVLAIGGNEDRDATLADIKRWSEYTQSKFQYYLFRGGHFFIKEDEENVLKLIHQKSEEFINREN